MKKHKQVINAGKREQGDALPALNKKPLLQCFPTYTISYQNKQQLNPIQAQATR